MSQPYKIGIFGPRGSGKTSLLTALYGYGQKETNPFSAKAGNSQTEEYLKERWQYWQKNNMAQPTPLQVIDLQLQFTYGNFSNLLEIKDFGGAMIMRDTNAEAEVRRLLKTQIYHFLQDCQAILLLVEYGTQEYEAFYRRLEIEVLLETLKVQFHRDSKPFGIVITKWDKNDQTKQAKSFNMQDYRQEHHKAVLYFETQHSDIYNLLEAASQNVSLFPVSICTPSGMEKPFVWAMDKIETGSLQNIQKFQKENPKVYREIIKRYKDFLAQTARKDLSSLAQTELSQVNKLFQKSKKYRRMAVLSIVLILCSAIWYFYSYYSFIKFVENSSLLPSRKGFDAILEYHSHSSWVMKVYEVYGKTGEKVYSNVLELSYHFPEEKDTAWRYSIYQAFLKLFPCYQYDDRLQSFSKKEEKLYILYREKKDWQELSSLQDKSSDKFAKERYIACSNFLEKYPHHSQIALVKRWRAEAQEGIHRQEFLEMCKQVQNTSVVEGISICKKFLQKYPDYDSAKKILAKLKLEQEKDIYNAIESLAQQKQYQKAIEECKKYLKNPEHKSYRNDVQKKQNFLANDWAFELYTPIYKLRDSYDMESFVKLNDLIDRYVQVSPLHKKMLPFLQKWKKWFENFKNGQSYYIVIEEATIGKKCSVVDSMWLWWPDSSITVNFNGKTASTQEVVDNWNPQFKTTCGPFWWKPGNPYSLVFSCTIHDRAKTISKSFYYSSHRKEAPYYFNGTISIPDGADSIEIKLSCSQAKPPQIPGYIQEDLEE
ncbi:MAG: GTPase domain-containing protein [Candidatus Brocadiae bacterium]|nr:GTPase domain-containing protein [Candidatus Brocadiia bacterium]